MANEKNQLTGKTVYIAHYQHGTYGDQCKAFSSDLAAIGYMYSRYFTFAKPEMERDKYERKFKWIEEFKEYEIRLLKRPIAEEESMGYFMTRSEDYRFWVEEQTIDE